MRIYAFPVGNHGIATGSRRTSPHMFFSQNAFVLLPFFFGGGRDIDKPLPTQQK